MNQQKPPPFSQEDNSQAGYEPDSPPQNRATPVRVPIKLPDIRPSVTYTLLGITVVVFVLQYVTQYLLRFDIPAAYGVKDNTLIANGQIWRLFTPMFLHGSILHIAFNMYALSKIGPRLERYYGHLRFLALYILSGIGGNIFSMMFTQAQSLGSSTAIFGLIGAQGVFFYHNREILGPAFRQALSGIITIAVVNLAIGFNPNLRIDNWGHVGGLVGGVIFAWLSGPILEVTGIYPEVALVDQRQSSETWQAIGIVAAFFSLLAAGALYLMQ